MECLDTQLTAHQVLSPSRQVNIAATRSTTNKGEFAGNPSMFERASQTAELDQWAVNRMRYLITIC